MGYLLYVVQYREQPAAIRTRDTSDGSELGLALKQHDTAVFFLRLIR